MKSLLDKVNQRNIHFIIIVLFPCFIFVGKLFLFLYLCLFFEFYKCASFLLFLLYYASYLFKTAKKVTRRGLASRKCALIEASLPFSFSRFRQKAVTAETGRSETWRTITKGETMIVHFSPQDAVQSLSVTHGRSNIDRSYFTSGMVSLLPCFSCSISD